MVWKHFQHCEMLFQVIFLSINWTDNSERANILKKKDIQYINRSQWTCSGWRGKGCGSHLLGCFLCHGWGDSSVALPGSRLAIMAVCKDSPGVCLIEPCAAEWDILEVFLVLICKVMMGREREQADEQPVTRPLQGPTPGLLQVCSGW